MAFHLRGDRNKDQTKTQKALAVYVFMVRPMCTCVTTEVDFKAASLVITLVTAWISTSELANLSKVSSVVGKQGTESDEGLFTSCKAQQTQTLIN